MSILATYLLMFICAVSNLKWNETALKSSVTLPHVEFLCFKLWILQNKNNESNLEEFIEYLCSSMDDTLVFLLSDCIFVLKERSTHFSLGKNKYKSTFNLIVYENEPKF